MTTQARIYVACLASYNNGVLHGAWIDVDDADTVRERIATMLRGSRFPNVTVTCPQCAGAKVLGVVATGPILCGVCGGVGSVNSAEEWAVHDQDLPHGLKCSEWADLEALCQLVEDVEEHGEAFALWYAQQGEHDDRDVDTFTDAYSGTYRSELEWAESQTEDMLRDVPDDVSRYFDHDAWLHDAKCGGDVFFIEGTEGTHAYRT